MEIFHSFQEITGFTGAVVALGTFDGIHKGHQMVMKTAIKRAAAGGVKPWLSPLQPIPCRSCARKKNRCA